MKTFQLLAFLLALPALPLLAQTTNTPSATPAASTSDTSDSDSTPILSSAELQQLVGPVALYSDPLLALILPASTYPTEVTEADNYLNNGGSQAGIADQNWDKSVQGLAHYPDVLHMMATNTDWTNQLGAAVLAQQADVMAAIQTMRAKAKNLGNLTTTPQQTVTTDNNAIEITPANPQTVYVPDYDPDVVYAQPAVVGTPWITFGPALGLGVWADFGFNWGWGGGGGSFICSGGYYSSSFGWSSSYHYWSSSHYSWHRDWHRGGHPHPPYHPGHGGHLPPWNHHGHDHGHDHGGGPDHHHGDEPDHHHGDHPDHGIIHGETYHPEEQHNEHRERDRDPNYDRDRDRREDEPHRHNTKENHDRHDRQHQHREQHEREHHARPEHHEEHHEEHQGGGGHRR